MDTKMKHAIYPSCIHFVAIEKSASVSDGGNDAPSRHQGDCKGRSQRVGYPLQSGRVSARGGREGKRDSQRGGRDTGGQQGRKRGELRGGGQRSRDRSKNRYLPPPLWAFPGSDRLSTCGTPRLPT